jgi:hypothetical protein
MLMLYIMYYVMLYYTIGLCHGLGALLLYGGLARR